MAMKVITRVCLPMMLLGLALVVAACEKSPALLGPGLGGSVTVTEVNVPAENRVKIVGDGNLKVSPFTLTGPLWIGVDVQNANLAPEGAPLPISGGGVIERVEVAAITDVNPPVVRVTAHMRSNATYRLEGEGQEVTIVFSPKEGTEEIVSAAEDALIPYEETKDELERLLTGKAPASYPDLPYYSYDASGKEDYATYTPLALAPLPPANSDGSASVVGDVFYRTINDGVQVMILTNGTVSNYVDFDLSGPPRVVVDLFGVVPLTKKRTYPVNWLGVSKVRVGKHLDKTRVVVDFSRKLPAYHVARTNSGIVITVLDHKYVPGGVEQQTYVTVEGDTMRSIAQHFYGTPEAWVRIMAANRDLLLKSEAEQIRRDDGHTLLGAGMRLKIPVR